MTHYVTGARDGCMLHYACPACNHEASLQIFRNYLDLRISVLCPCGVAFLVRDEAVGNPVAPTMIRRENKFDLRDER